MLTIDQLYAAVKKYRRLVLIWLAIGVLLTFAYLGSWRLFNHALFTWCGEHFGEPTAEIIRGLSTFPAVLFMFGTIWFGERRAQRDSRLSCPYCDKTFVNMHHTVVASRNCPHCGRRILKEPETTD